MIGKLIQITYAFKPRDYIPPAPRMYATQYDVSQVTEDQWRVIRRLGARDPSSVALAMRRHGVATVDELVAQLEHYTPQRRVRLRIIAALSRLVGGYQGDPNRREIARALRQPGSHRRRTMIDQVRERQRDAKRAGLIL